jgi:hypothetical protein
MILPLDLINIGSHEVQFNLKNVKKIKISFILID